METSGNLFATDDEASTYYDSTTTDLRLVNNQPDSWNGVQNCGGFKFIWKENDASFSAYYLATKARAAP